MGPGPGQSRGRKQQPAKHQKAAAGRGETTQMRSAEHRHGDTDAETEGSGEQAACRGMHEHPQLGLPQPERAGEQGRGMPAEYLDGGAQCVAAAGVQQSVRNMRGDGSAGHGQQAQQSSACEPEPARRVRQAGAGGFVLARRLAGGENAGRTTSWPLFIDGRF